MNVEVKFNINDLEEVREMAHEFYKYYKLPDGLVDNCNGIRMKELDADTFICWFGNIYRQQKLSPKCGMFVGQYSRETGEYNVTITR